jgi:DNA invertase Pin-like site-specific DNA recombinase
VTAASNTLRPGGLPKRTVAYIRVSSKSQDYKYQRLAIERECQRQGVVIHRWYGDVASGAGMARPQLKALREAVRAGDVEAVWVWRLDRLTRSGILDTLSAVNDLRKYGCAVRSVADPFALEGPAAEMVLAALAWAAQLERQKIRENQQAARARMVAEGRRWGRPPVAHEKRERVIQLAHSIPRLSQRRIARLAQVSKTFVQRVLSENDSKAAAENMLFQRTA